MTQKIVPIPQDISESIAQKFYIQNGIQGVITFLLNTSPVDKELFDEQSNKYIQAFAELEEMKTSAANTFYPKDMDKPYKGYTFNFNDSSIIYDIE